MRTMLPTSLAAALLLLGATVAQADSLNLTDSLNGSSVTVLAGQTFDVKVYLNSTVPTVGLSYFLEASSAGAFQIVGRNLSGSDFSDPNTPDSDVTATPSALLSPQNGSDLGATLADVTAPAKAGDYYVSTLRLQTLAGTVNGVYTLSFAGASEADANFDDVALSGGRYTINVVPEASTVVGWSSLLALGSLSILRRSTRRRA